LVRVDLNSGINSNSTIGSGITIQVGTAAGIPLPVRISQQQALSSTQHIQRRYR